MKKLHIATVLILSAFLSTPASSQVTAFDNGIGVRIGGGLDPDQVVAGVQADVGRFGTLFRVLPSFDAGFGDDQSVYSINGDIVLPLYSPAESALGFYLGGGPTILILDFDNTDSDTELGLSVIGGSRFAAGSRNAYTIEARFGIGDVPEIRVLFGILFGAQSRLAPEGAYE